VYDTVQIGLDLPTPALDTRIAKRVDLMIDDGFEAEVRALDALGLRQGVTASRALGYAQLLAVIDGRISLDQARAETAQGTRRLVRRQRSWFRRDPRIRWFEPSAGLMADLHELITT
jgi:tRNA dimethylallyltransferase